MEYRLKERPSRDCPTYIQIPNTDTVANTKKCLYFHWILESLQFLSLFLLWPIYNWPECYSVSISMWDFCCFCCYWRSPLVHSNLIECMGLFQFFCICWSLFSFWLCDQFWIMYYDELRRRYILLFYMKWSLDIS